MKDRSYEATAAALIVVNAAIDAATLWWVALVAEDSVDSSFVIWLLVGAAIGAALVLGVWRPGMLIHRGFWRKPWSHLLHRDFLGYTASRFDWPLVAAAAALIGGLPTAIILATQTLLFIPLLGKLDSRPSAERWQPVGVRRFGLVIVSCGGAALAIAAQYDPNAGDGGHSAGLITTGVGVALAIAAMVAATLSAMRFPLAMRIHVRLELPTTGRTKELPAILLIHILGCLVTATAVVVVTGLPNSASFWSGMGIGGLLLTGGILTRSLGCLLTRDLTVNSLAYLTPLFTFVLFWVTGKTSNVNMLMIAVAAVMVVGSNMTLTLGAQRKISAAQNQ